MKYTLENVNKIAEEWFNDKGVLKVISIESIQNFIAPKFHVKQIFCGFSHSMLVLIDKTNNDVVNYKIRYTDYIENMTDNEKIAEVL